MAIQKHDLIHELPEHKDTIHDLKVNDAHFARLFDEYHQVDKEMHRIEENIETQRRLYQPAQARQTRTQRQTSSNDSSKRG